MTEEYIPNQRARQNLRRTKQSEANPCDKDFKVIIIKMLIKLGRRMDIYSEGFNRDIKIFSKYQTEVLAKLKTN